MARLCWDVFLNHGNRANFFPVLSFFIFEGSQKVQIADCPEQVGGVGTFAISLLAIN